MKGEELPTIEQLAAQVRPLLADPNPAEDELIRLIRKAYKLPESPERRNFFAEIELSAVRAGNNHLQGELVRRRVVFEVGRSKGPRKRRNRRQEGTTRESC
jgi:hypothetical protein